MTHDTTHDTFDMWEISPQTAEENMMQSIISARSAAELNQKALETFQARERQRINELTEMIKLRILVLGQPDSPVFMSDQQKVRQAELATQELDALLKLVVR